MRTYIDRQCARASKVHKLMKKEDPDAEDKRRIRDYLKSISERYDRLRFSKREERQRELRLETTLNDCLYLGDKRRDISDLNSLLAKEYEDAETAWVNREGGKLEINGQKYDSMQEYVVGFILSRYLINEKNEPFTISAGKTYQYCIGPKKVDYVVPVEYLQDGARRGVCLEWHPSGSQRIRDRYKCARRALADNDGKVAYVIADRHINNNINSLYEFVNEQCRVRDGFPGKEGFGIVFKDELQRITKLRELSKQKMVWLDLDCELRGRDVSDLSDAEVMTFWSKESTKQNQFGSRFKYSKRIMNFLNYTGATNLLWSIAIRRYLEQFYRGGQDLFADDDGKVRWIMRSVSSQIEKYLPLDLQSKLPNLEDDGLADGGRVYGKFIQHVFGREDLAAVKFENCVFKGCNFRDVACEGVRFEECVFEECVFEGLQLVGSDFWCSFLINCSFTDSNLHGTYFGDVTMTGGTFKDVDLLETDWENAKLDRVTFDTVRFGGTLGLNSFYLYRSTFTGSMGALYLMHTDVSFTRFENVSGVWIRDCVVDWTSVEGDIKIDINNSYLFQQACTSFLTQQSIDLRLVTAENAKRLRIASINSEQSTQYQVFNSNDREYFNPREVNWKYDGRRGRSKVDYTSCCIDRNLPGCDRSQGERGDSEHYAVTYTTEDIEKNLILSLKGIRYGIFADVRLEDAFKIEDCCVSETSFTGSEWGCFDIIASQFMNVVCIRMHVQAGSWIGTKFENVDLTAADLRQFCLKDCQITRVDFIGARLIGGGFDGCELSDTSFDGAVLENVSFDGVALKDVSFDGAVLENVSFDGADLHNVSFEGVDLETVSGLEGVTSQLEV